MKAFGEAVGLIVAFVALLWGALIYYAGPDQKPIIACKPLLVMTSGLQTTAAAASSANSGSQASNAAHIPKVNDSGIGREVPLADRVALGCLRFTDRLFNK
ncbi:hypothetical protein RQP54_18405 [Curvibacter sp. APW13]|uniref:hypothetical protein n=1 Tax=Curvibacter sp. APW13 TaxID=3077236 RepID=UPI0028DF72C6|nr:hypothetical protein [Curvibacter sp. APW13]MDT8992852.1 hypothetical protein [Curvibacter sp. APW13]